MRFIILLLLTLSLPTQACPKYQMVKSGDIVPCSGIFLNQAINEAVKKDLRDYKLTLSQLSISQDNVKDLIEDRDKWAKEAHKQAKARYSQSNDLRNGFIVGVGLTLAIMLTVKWVWEFNGV